MEKFEYEITRYPSETFNRLVYFCTVKGDCALQEVPSEEPLALLELLNEKGARGWELVQLLFGNGGVMACWKRKITDIIES
ncbi:MAG: hypothetical protein ACP5VS_04085 [Desulfomonilaceae bacterium]